LCARLSGRKSFAQLTPSPTRFTPQSISPWPRRKTHRSTSGALPRSSSTSPLTPIIETREGLLKGLVAPSSKWIGQSSNTTGNITSFIDLIWIERFPASLSTCGALVGRLKHRLPQRTDGCWIDGRDSTSGSRRSWPSAVAGVEKMEMAPLPSRRAWWHFRLDLTGLGMSYGPSISTAVQRITRK
jgi:hypothetical protein